MEIHLPNSAFLGNIDSFIRGYNSINPDELKITTNKSWISLHPMCICMIAVLGMSIKNRQTIKIDSFEAKSGHYFERIGLFKLLGIESGINIIEHESAGRFIPLSIISNSKNLDEFITNMIPLLHLEPDYAEPIKYVISELVRNVFEHSQYSPGAVVCAQYYKKSNAIRIGVVDGGIGIKRSISQSYKPQSDLDAILLGLTPGITGTTNKVGGTELNAGAGLFFIKSIAKVNRDFFIVYSGNAMYKLLKETKDKIKLSADPLKDKHSSNEELPYWRGTSIGIDITLDRHQKFDFLLDLIREAYQKDIKKRKTERFKKPRFI